MHTKINGKGYYDKMYLLNRLQYNKNFLSVHDIFVNAGFDLSRKQSSTNLQQAEGFPSDKMTDNHFDGIRTPFGKTKHNALWMPQVGILWNIK